MQIGNVLQEMDNISKICVDIDLLKKGLCESMSVHFVVCIWSIENLLSIFPHAFMSEIRLAITSRFLHNSYRISPGFGGFCIVCKVNFDCNFWVLSRCQTTDFRYASAVFDCFLKSTAFCFYNISKKAKNIEKVGLTGRIRAYDKLTLAKWNIEFSEIAPVFYFKTFDNHNNNSHENRNGSSLNLIHGNMIFNSRNNSINKLIRDGCVGQAIL